MRIFFLRVRMVVYMPNTAFFTDDFTANVSMMDGLLRVNNSFDLVGRNIKFASKNAKIYLVDGFIREEIMVKIMGDMLMITPEKLEGVTESRDFADKFIPYMETDVMADTEKFMTLVLSGAAGILVEGYKEAIVVDVRTYPMRSVEEPDSSRVLMGPHEGFVETLIFNTAMLRRRLRDPMLTVETMQLGKRTKLDIAICYLDDKVDRKHLRRLKNNLCKIEANTLTMGQESILESLSHGQRYNPFPKVRYTERPDAAAAIIAEGSIVMIIDNTPAAMIVPTSFFDFMQDTNDFYFPAIIGTFLRLVRITVSALNFLVIPVWYVLITHEQYIPAWLDFIKIEEPVSLPIFVQLLIIEMIVDTLQLAALNTPKSLSSSFSLIGSLVLGEFAVKAQWLASEVVLYMAFVAIANFAHSSFELGYAFKISRLFMLVATAIFGMYGFIGSFLLVFIMLATTKTVTGRRYLYPFIPFNAKAMGRLFIRRPLSKDNN